MSAELQLREFLTQLKNFQAVDPELQKQKELENQNNPSLLKFNHDFAEQQAENAVQLFGDQVNFKTKEKEEKKNFLESIISWLNPDEEDNEILSGLRAYSDEGLFPKNMMNEINSIAKEYELSKELRLIA